MAEAAHLANWTGQHIAKECTASYAAYRQARTESYRSYFRKYPHLRAADHEYKAKDIAAVLPDGWEGLAAQLSVSERHPQHLSGNSSQILALGLLGVGAKLDPSLSWFWDGLSPLPPAAAPAPAATFEHKLAPETLHEQPRQTSLDLFVDDPAALLCVECKWTEAGMGACGCGPTSPMVADCSQKVLDRTAYWRTAYELFGLPKRTPGRPCPLSFAYQAVRNVAAALALARRGQEPVFGLFYDAANPYFAGCGQWPGWPVALRDTIAAEGGPVRFCSVSWQELLPLLPLDQAALDWAAEKHGLRLAS